MRSPDYSSRNFNNQTALRYCPANVNSDYESGIEATFEKRLYDPLKDWIFSLSRRMRAIQAGSIHAYLAYIFVTLILLLLFGVRQ